MHDPKMDRLEWFARWLCQLAGQDPDYRFGPDSDPKWTLYTRPLTIFAGEERSARHKAEFAAGMQAVTIEHLQKELDEVWDEFEALQIEFAKLAAGEV